MTGNELIEDIRRKAINFTRQYNLDPNLLILSNNNYLTLKVTLHWMRSDCYQEYVEQKKFHGMNILINDSCTLPRIGLIT